jgi:hypothetical protein
MGSLHRSKSLRSDSANGVLPEDAARTQKEFAAALRALGWELDGPTRTSAGWKATIQRDGVSVLSTGSKPEEVLEDLLHDVKQRAKQP